MSLRPLRLAVLTMALPGLFLAACSGVGAPPATTGSGTATASPGFADRMSSMVFGPPPKPGEGKVEAPTPDDCPMVTVRQGAATVTVYGSGAQAATNVRYQATVGELARECAIQGGTVSAKLGLQGRVILGPSGGPGRLEVPVRFALVREGPEPKTVWTQMYRVPVDVPQGQTNVPFVHIEDRISFPMPSARELEAYVFYVGFDQQGVREPRRGQRR